MSDQIQTQPPTEADPGATQAVQLVTPTHAEIAAISGVILNPLGPTPDENGLVKTIMITHPGSNRALITTDLVEGLAWLAQKLDITSVARYEVMVSPYPYTEYVKLPDDTEFQGKVSNVKLLTPGDF